MSFTARNTCTDALAILGVPGLGRTPSDRQLSAALDHLNRMMHGLNSKGAVIEWSDKGLEDTMPLDDDVRDIAAHALANRLQGPVGQFPNDPDTKRRMRGAENRLKGYFTPPRSEDSGYF